MTSRASEYRRRRKRRYQEALDENPELAFYITYGIWPSQYPRGWPRPAPQSRPAGTPRRPRPRQCHQHQDPSSNLSDEQSQNQISPVVCTSQSPSASSESNNPSVIPSNYEHSSLSTALPIIVDDRIENLFEQNDQGPLPMEIENLSNIVAQNDGTTQPGDLPSGSTADGALNSELIDSQLDDEPRNSLRASVIS